MQRQGPDASTKAETVAAPIAADGENVSLRRRISGPLLYVVYAVTALMAFYHIYILRPLHGIWAK